MEKFQLPSEYDTAELQKLVELFPQFWRESYFDFDEFKAYISGVVPDDLQEKYSFTWHGKSESYRLLKKNSHGTLRPCKEDSVNWDTTQNLYIEGDNLEVLKLIKHTYAGERGVKMIYIDPPYNTSEDFIYDDNFMDTLDKYLDYTGQKGIAIPEFGGRYHTRWLNMMYPRLWLANYLLRDDGVIFISIDDNEVHNLRKMCDEVFGEENFEGHIHWRRRHNQPNDKTKMIGLVAEHIICYAKSSSTLRASGVGKVDLTGDFSNPDNDPRGDWASKPWKVGSDQSGSRYVLTTPTGKEMDEEWMGDENTYEGLLADNRIIFPRGGDGMPRKKYFRYEREEEGQCATNWWEHSQFGHNQGANDIMTSLFGVKNVFSNPKPVELLRGLLQIANVKSDDIVLDFFSGSATTAHAVMQLKAEDKINCKFICVQLPENLDTAYKVATGKKKAQLKVSIDFLDSIGKPHFITDIGKERIRLAGKEIIKTHPDVDIGFRVFKLDKSNFKIWDDTPVDPKNPSEVAKLYEQLEIHADSPFIEGRSHEDIVYEIMRMNNYPLTTAIIPIEINGKIVYGIGEDCDFIICLDVPIDDTAAEELCTYRPGRILFTDNCFKDTETRVNVEHTIKNINDKIKLRVV